jgi:hypothetical protein
MSSISRAAIYDTSQSRGGGRLRVRGLTERSPGFHVAAGIQRLVVAIGEVSLNIIMAGAAFGQTNWTGLTRSYLKIPG